MRFLRSTSTGRLLGAVAGLVIVIVATTAIAVAASGSGPVPKHRPLAVALHRALSAPAIKGFYANISFTNNLIDASSFQGSDPLLQGTPEGRLWISSDHRLRLELQSTNGDAQIVVNKTSFWVSDPAQHVVYEGTLPAEHPRTHAGQAKAQPIPSIATIQADLNKLMKHLAISGAIPGDIANRPTYTVRLSPHHDGGLLGSARIAWDALRGVPLSLGIYARGNPKPVLALTATGVSYGKQAPSVFNVTPPPGAKVVKVSTAGLAGKHATSEHGRRTKVSGARAVAAKLPFKLHAPHSLIALPRQGVKLLDWGGKPAALVTYGRGLGAIAVIEQVGTAKSLSSPSTKSGGDGQAGFSLPTVSIHGATGSELDTALGTVIRFSRAGVGYTVLGSVPPVAAEKAARGL
ncbi:MAG: hypothetical protein M3016_05940 [Actinomycetota bacterium]|nr:hypothetical protein [Actinomycetota bacterium]